MHILDGRPIAREIYSSLKDFSGLKPKIAIVYSTDEPSALVYLNVKLKRMKKYGIETEVVFIEPDADENVFISKVDELNSREDIDGIFIELPLPNHVDYYKLVSRICPLKDVEGVSPWNLGNMFYMKEFAVPSTVEAVLRIFEYYNIELEGKDVVVMGKGIATGKPLTVALLNRNATVQNIHKSTKNKSHKTKQADILVVSIGVPKYVNREFVKEGAIVVDIGTNYTDEGLVGDVDFDDVKDIVSAITPVPGGIGPITTAITVRRCFELKLKRMQTAGR